MVLNNLLTLLNRLFMEEGREVSTSHRFHLIGIGGAGMSVVAELLKDRGLEVSGSDQKESPILDHLRDAGLKVFVGHDAAHVPADSV